MAGDIQQTSHKCVMPQPGQPYKFKSKENKREGNGRNYRLSPVTVILYIGFFLCDKR
jgi:hypothetical protein